MPDISMCVNNSCKSKEKCYRFRAKPSSYQSVSVFPIEKGRVKCDHFWSIKDFREDSLSPIGEELGRDFVQRTFD